MNHVFLVPGMFGFAELAGYDYFVHVRNALVRRYADAGEPIQIHVVPTPPTSSIRHRALMIARAIQHEADDGGPVHLLGHSTGGLDARLLLSPTSILTRDAEDHDAERDRVRSSISLNTPHYGTPVATYFASVAGTRVLYALSLLTIVSLSLGTSSLSVFARLFAALGGIDQILGGDLRLISRVTDMMLRYVDSDSRRAIETYLNKMRLDQGAIIQITPEAMDVFNAATEDNPGVRYGCIVTGAPPPKPLAIGRRIRSPYTAFSAAMFSTLYTVASQRHVRYGYLHATDTERLALQTALEMAVDDETNDGIVPTMSMVWGEVLWAGQGDHLDVIGHFDGKGDTTAHVDWLTSTTHFDRIRFAKMMDAVVASQLASG